MWPVFCLEGMAVRHIHWGGGTPTALAPEDMIRISETLQRQFNILGKTEIAVEIDPGPLPPKMRLRSARSDAARQPRRAGI